MFRVGRADSMRVLLVLGLAAMAAAAPKKLSSKFLSTPMVRVENILCAR